MRTALLLTNVARAFLGATFLLAIAAPSWASDGALEINQTCAVETGCFAGDTPGYPVTISEPGSYGLSSNLAIATDVDGILITSSYVTLDLNGFEIAGNTTCTGTGATLSCGTGVGSGVFASGSPTGTSIRNGTLRNHQLMAIRAEGRGHRVQDVLARHNGSDGINLEFDSVCQRCIAIENERDGIRMNQGAVVKDCVVRGNGREGIVLTGNGGVVSGSTSTGNGGTGIQLSGESGTVFGSSSRENVGAGFFLQILSKFGKDNVSGNNGAVDSCGEGICSDRRRYYRTVTQHDALEARTACAGGFHQASLWEILQPSTLLYDWQLGSGGGIDLGPDDSPNSPGWIVAPFFSPQCDVTMVGDGSTASLILPGSSSVLPPSSSPWELDPLPCTVASSVWCIEDD